MEKGRERSSLCLILLLSVSFLFPIVSLSLASTPIRIGLTLGLTGRYAEMSEMQRKGYELWQREVNSKKGLLGREVRLIIYDDQSDPVRAKKLYEILINKDQVDLVFSPYSSEITEAVSTVTERHSYPMIAAGASSDRIWQKGYKYIFGLYSPASRYTQGFLELLIMKGIDNLSVVAADDPFSLETAEGTKKWAERLGLKINHSEVFKKSQKDLADIARKAKASGARVLILCGHLEESINMKQSLKRIGWNPIFYATVGPATERFYKILGDDSELTFSSSQWEYIPTIGNNREFYESFKKVYGIEPTYHAATAYAAGHLLEEAVKRAGRIDREKLRNILSSIEAITIIGRYRVDQSGLQIRHQSLIIQWQRGKKEILWPESLKTADPILR